MFTGDPLLSPYAWWRGKAIPVEIRATSSQIMQNLTSIWRVAAEGTVLYAFPFIFPLAAFGFWKNRGRGAAWILVVLFAAMVGAHLIQPEHSASIIGERYWFEGFFAVAVLAAAGIVRLLAVWRPTKRAGLASLAVVAAAQIVMLAVASYRLDVRSAPPRAVRALAINYATCDCVVFLRDAPPRFHGHHLNLNVPDWPSARVFYAVDPGPDQRATWTMMLGKPKWVVLTYDEQTGIGRVEDVGPS